MPKGNDDFRLLIVNMIGPNRAIRRRFLKMPSLEGIKVKLQRSKNFTKLDLTSAFYHVSLGEKSKEMATFSGPDCTVSVGSISERAVRRKCSNKRWRKSCDLIPNALLYIDDILVYVDTLQNLQAGTKKVLATLKANNLTLNRGKGDWEEKSIEFLGHELSEEDVNISRKKVASVMSFRKPKDTTELKNSTFLVSLHQE